MADSRTEPGDGGFLSRWARRKEAARRGAAPVAEPAVAMSPPVATLAQPAAGQTTLQPVSSQAVVEPTPPPAQPPAPTLEDAEALTPSSDFRRFVGRDVDPAVKNTALKKLFADPHFNVMDGLDTYIDDYSRPDPIPAAMLAQMMQSRLLGLVRDEEAPPRAEALPATTLPADSAISTPEHAAETVPEPSAKPLPEALDEDPDLRLQPHDAARHGGDPPGPSGDAGRLG